MKYTPPINIDTYFSILSSCFGIFILKPNKNTNEMAKINTSYLKIIKMPKLAIIIDEKEFNSASSTLYVN